MFRSLILSSFVSLMIAGAPNLYADVVQLPDQTKQTFAFELPGRGMSMTAVEERFGKPLERGDEVGDPPISRWVYGEFTVYFEYQFVIHAVLNPTRN